MVFLTMTASMVEALDKVESLKKMKDDNICTGKAMSDQDDKKLDNATEEEGRRISQEITVIDKPTHVPVQTEAEVEKGDGRNQSIDPSLSNPQIGNLISHGQVIDLWKETESQNLRSYSLENLLKGSRVYNPPPPPKPEPVGSHYDQRSSLSIYILLIGTFTRPPNTKP